MSKIPLMILLTSLSQFSLSPIALASSDSMETEQQLNSRTYQDNWGIAIGQRNAQIPYATEDDNVQDIIPLLFYQDEYFSINGLEANVHLWKNDAHQVNAYTRFRFVDIPQSYQNQAQADAFDFGVQYVFTHNQWQTDVAILNDGRNNWYSYSRAKYYYQQGDWQLTPFAEIQWKSQAFNEHYYGLELEEVDSGIAFSAGLNAKYHVINNLYLLGNIGFHRLEDNVAALPFIDQQYQWESFIGFGFFPNPNAPKNIAVKDDTNEYLRVAHGWATPSNLNDILTGKGEKDPYNNQMTSLFYGRSVINELFTLPIDLYFIAGGIWHHDSEVQDNLAEGVLGFKAYYTSELGPRWRIGVAEGLSYVSDITHIERSELEEKEYQPSKLLNYLDFSFDVNVGDIFNQTSLQNMWFGYSIHHRSGIFETSSAFGRIKGGSNYNTLYLQWHF